MMQLGETMSKYCNQVIYTCPRPLLRFHLLSRYLVPNPTSSRNPDYQRKNRESTLQIISIPIDHTMQFNTLALLALTSTTLAQSIQHPTPDPTVETIDFDHMVKELVKKLHQQAEAGSVGQPGPGQNKTQSFLVKTHLKPNQSTTTELTRFDNLWLSSARTGAGTGDAVFTSDITQSVQGFFDYSRKTVDGTHATSTGGFAALNFVGVALTTAFTPTRTAYDAWSFVQINNGDHGALVWKDSLDLVRGGFMGWMVCDWWHGMPQLFVRYNVTAAPAVPVGCADIELRKVWI